LEAGRSTVGAALKVGQYPADMRVGDPVLLITPAAQDGTINGQQKQGVVATFQAPSRDSGTASASFVVDQSDAATLATAGADGKLAIVVLPR
jgi:hypothetical protein